MALSKFLNPKNDVAFLKIFGTEKNKNILIHFINDILFLTGNDAVQDVEFLSTILNAEAAGKKQSIVDVLCRDNNGVQFIVEMQVAPTKGFEKRAQYYAAKAYTRPLNKGSNDDGKYANLKEVIFIAIVTCILFPEKKEYISNHKILDTETYEHDLQGLNFTFIELPKFKKDKVELLENIVEKWLYFFKHANETSESDLKKITGNDFVIEEAFEALNQFNWTEQELIAYENEQKRIWDNQAALEYQLDKAAEEGMAKGMAKGMEKGMAEGVIKGRAEGKAQGKAEGRAESMEEVAIKMLKQNIDIDTISLITNLKAETILKLKK